MRNVTKKYGVLIFFASREIDDMLSRTRGLGGQKITRGEKVDLKKMRKFQRRDLRAQGERGHLLVELKSEVESV